MRSMRAGIQILLACTAVVIAFALGNAARIAAQPSGARATGAESLQDAFVRVYQQVSPSVVQIETSEGLGSGIVFDSKGDIVTNAHVVGSAKTSRVTTSAGKTLRARSSATFREDDLAVIKVRRPA